MKPATHVHDRINLVLLPLLGAGCVAGLLWQDLRYTVTVSFLLYTLVDFAVRAGEGGCSL